VRVGTAFLWWVSI
jgi:hypothetical protein